MKSEGPTLTKKDDLGERYAHPAFGCVTISQTQGTAMPAFMSNVKHQNMVRFAVSRASMTRQFNEFKHLEEEEICHFSMTMVQFAELMGSMNRGGGVPCTLEWVRGEGYKPGIDMENTVKRYATEVKDEFRKLGKQVNGIVAETRAALEAAKLSKVKQDVILAPLVRLAQDLGSNVPFMQDMFVEGIESIIAEAKSVVESYASERGLEPGTVPLMIGGGDE